MIDLDKALAAARESLANEGHRSADALRDLLAALDAAQGEAVAWVDRRELAVIRPHFNMRAVLYGAGFGDDSVPLFAAPPAAAVSAEPAPNPESADFKAGMAIGRAESEFLAGAIKNPACGLCGATCEKDAEAKCRPSGDSCPGTEWPLANLWALQAPPSAVVPEVLLEVGRSLAEDRKRNDHYTADPIYTVQREVCIYGLDADYADRFAWIEGSELCASDLSARLERRFNRGWTIPERYRRVGYCTRWEFVDAYLSYDAAKRRVEYENRKHHGTYRTYVESGCRNHEWKALQAWLLAAAERKGE